MVRMNLSPEDKARIIEAINKDAEPSADLLPKLFPGTAEKFDIQSLDRAKIPTLEYAGKRSKAAILSEAGAGIGAAPLQTVRCFGDVKKDGWRNLIVQGDNLQFLKTCYNNTDPLIKNKVKGKVKLIYIDPPFATKSDFGGREGERSYSDKVANSEFIEGLRERIIYLRELLSNKGRILLHLDQKMSHYAKIILDEVFGKDNFRNEIVWGYGGGGAPKTFYPNKHDILFWYTKSTKWIFNKQFRPYSDKTLSRGLTAVKGDNYKLADEGAGQVDCWVDDEVQKILSPTAYENLKYPTQKPEGLLKRIIIGHSDPDDLFIDCFAGSGTAPAVAEKLGRRWIACDFGKHAIYTMQRRLLRIGESKALVEEKDEIGNIIVKKGDVYNKLPKPFSVISSGAYDFSHIMNLRKHKNVYIDFVLGLFQLTRNEEKAKKFRLANIYTVNDNNPVEVYPVWNDEFLTEVKIDEDYLQDIINQSGGKLKGEYNIITPEIMH